MRLDSVALDNGTEITSEIVDTSDSVIVLPLLSDSEVILIRQYRYAAAQWLLEAPAGGATGLTTNSASRASAAIRLSS